MKNDVTIIIATYNRSQYLDEAIQSILNQTIPAKQVIVVDDGSTDDTALVAKKFGDKITYLKKENGGKSSALNHALGLVATTFVWFFDDDDIAYPSAIECLTERMHDDERAAFSFGFYDVLTESSSGTARELKSFSYLHKNKTPQWQKLELFRQNTLMLTGSILRTSAVRSVAGLNNALIRCQDYDLLLRLASKYPFLYCDTNVYAWRQHDGARGKANEQHKAAGRLSKWAHYNEPIGHYLRDTLSLKDFSPDRSPDLSDMKVKRKALIIRAWTTATKLPALTTAEDIVSAFRADPHSPLDTDEKRILLELYHHAFTPYRLPIPYLRISGISLCAPGNIAARLIAKGLYWCSCEQESALYRVQLFFSSSVIFFLSILSSAYASTKKSG